VGLELERTSSFDDVVVAGCVAGSAAALSGAIRTHDVLLTVDGIGFFGKSLVHVRQAIRGPKGTVVRLKFSREGRTFEVVLARKHHLPSGQLAEHMPPGTLDSRFWQPASIMAFDSVSSDHTELLLRSERRSSDLESSIHRRSEVFGQRVQAGYSDRENSGAKRLQGGSRFGAAEEERLGKTEHGSNMRLLNGGKFLRPLLRASEMLERDTRDEQAQGHALGHAPDDEPAVCTHTRAPEHAQPRALRDRETGRESLEELGWRRPDHLESREHRAAPHSSAPLRRQPKQHAQHVQHAHHAQHAQHVQHAHHHRHEPCRPQPQQEHTLAQRRVPSHTQVSQ
jgi:hypothetical protein